MYMTGTCNHSLPTQNNVQVYITETRYERLIIKNKMKVYMSVTFYRCLTHRTTYKSTCQ